MYDSSVSSLPVPCPEKTESEASIDFKVKDWALRAEDAPDGVSQRILGENRDDAWLQDGVSVQLCRIEKQLQASMNTGMATWNMGLPFTQKCFYTITTEGKQSKCSCSTVAAGIADAEEC